ncbi:MAG: glycoside hydrolase family 3 C-terminal domain-containing protein [Bacteroidales bacterium]
MRKVIILLLVILGNHAITQTVPDYKNPGLPPTVRVKDLLSRMTPEEKFWQCFMLNESWEIPKERYHSGVFGFEGGESDGFNTAQNQVIKLNTKGDAGNLPDLINNAQRFFMERTRLGIPFIAFGEALHGLIRNGAVSFPQSIGLAATFDTSLMHRVSEAIALETRHSGIRMVLSPVVNIANDPRWGRTEETYGEDPCLSSAMGVAFVSGFEKNGVITCPKHFVANHGEGGRDSYPVHHDERFLNEVYFPPFKACIRQGGSRSVMTAYNSLSGVPCTASDWLQNEILRKQWGFSGFVISDAGATGGSNCLHMTAKDYYESTVAAMNNGLDVIFQTHFDHHTLFMPPFLDGSIEKTAIDSAVFRVLKAKFQLGLFENPYTGADTIKSLYDVNDNIKLAREAAQKSIVLLKNENNVLPLSKNVKSLTIIGPDALEARLGGYSGKGYNKVSILEGIITAGGGDPKTGKGGRYNILYEPGCGRQSDEFTVIPDSILFILSNNKKESGLKGEYFNNIELSGDPVLTRIDKNIDFRWTLYSPDPAVNYDWFSVRWTGKLKSPVSGEYQIGISGNDGYRLYINDSLVIDNWRKVSFRSLLVSYSFVKDTVYDLRLEFHETSGSVWFHLVWDAGMAEYREFNIAKAVESAKKSDVVIFVAGIEEGEGLDRAYLNLPGRQEEQILKLASLGKPLVVILCGGSAITMNTWIDKVPAILDVWYPGEQGGNAIADILFGDYNPAGRLPLTFPVTEGQLPLYYYHKPTGRNDDYSDLTGEALFPFGYGLSYTQFTYSDLKIERQQIRTGENAVLSFSIENSGELAGEEVPQLYIKDLFASVARPMKELRYFDRIFLKAGEKKKVTWTITPEMLTMPDLNLNEIIEPGDFRILIGSSSKDIRLRGTLNVTSK